MNKIHWYRRDPSAALHGMRCLTLEERGAYNTVLDLIYDTMDKLENDDRRLAHECCCDVRIWKRIKQVLISRGKITIQDGFIRNTRVAKELARAIARGASASQAALSKHAKSKSSSAKNKNLAPADAHADAHADALLCARNLESKKERKKDSETKVSAAPNGSADATVVDFKKPCYDLGKQILGSRYGALITDALKTKPPDQVLKLLQAAQGRHNPTAYFTGALVKSVKQQGLDLCRA